jgi:hypothetical protein
MNATNNLQYLPWTWTVKSSDPDAHCPPASSVLGTFAIVNVLVSLVGLVSGNRIVVNKISCGFLGRLGSRRWAYMWILTLALQFGSNILVATIIKHTEGYGNDFSIPELMLFFITRPRLSWMFLSVASNIRRKTNKKRSPLTEHSKGTPLTRYGSSGYGEHSTPPESSFYERPWEGSYMSQLIAEVILQLINLYTTGRIANFATTHGYYKINQEYHSLPRAAHLMYAGALLFTVALPMFFFFNVSLQFFCLRRRKDEEETMLDAGIILATQILVWSLAISTWLSSWLIWSGYVLLMGDL